MLFFLFLFLLLESSPILFTWGDPDEAWDINYQCKPFINQLATKQVAMVRCAVENNSPSQVCTKCVGQYIDLRQEDHRSRNLTQVSSLDNRTCSTVIYNSYGISYVQEVYRVLAENIWSASKCQECLQINWDFEHGNSTYTFDNKTIQFKKHLWDWRHCVMDGNGSLCKSCQTQYENLFDFYWKIYINPDIFFCIDLDSEMNDTMKLWRDVFGCPDKPIDRSQDATVLIFSVIILSITIGLFYAGSYIQSEKAQSTLIHYSRLQESQPMGDRSRILSSSTLDSSYLNSTPSSSLRG